MRSAKIRPHASSSRTRSKARGATATRARNVATACAGDKRFSSMKTKPRCSMLDIALVRRDPDRVRHSAQRRGIDISFVDEILRLDAQYRSQLAQAERLKAEKNQLSAQIGKAADKAAAARELRPQLDTISAGIALADEEAKALAPDAPGSPLRALLENTPNVLDDSVPNGSGAD